MKNRINEENGMEFGLYSLGDHMMNPIDGQKISQEQRLKEIVELSKYAEQAGIDVFSVGESHQRHFTTQGHAVVLGAIAQATETIKITSSSTVLSVHDPVRIYEDFATIDLLSGGRAEIIAGRGSRVGAYSLLGVALQDYGAMVEEKLDLLKQLKEQETMTWAGEFRAPLQDADQGVQRKESGAPGRRAVA